MVSGDDLYNQALDEASKNDGDVEKAFLLLNKAIEKNNSLAAYALATWYLHGYGDVVKKNISKGTKLLRQAADNNIPDALYDLAFSYESGQGVKMNLKLAMEYYLRAALYGDKQSLYEVGRCYYYGIGIEKNKRLAKIWLAYAEEQGVHE